MTGRGRNIFARAAGAALLLLAAALLAVQVPAVQTRLAGKALDSLNESLGGRLEVGSIAVAPPNSVVLKDVVCLDPDPCRDLCGRGRSVSDTLFHAGTVSATVSLRSLLSGSPIRLGRVCVSDGSFTLAMEPDSLYGTNIERIFALSGSDEEEGPWGDVLRVGGVSIRNFRYKMVNFCPDGTDYDEGCINYEDMDLVANIEAHDIKVKDGLVCGVVDSLSCTEKSGYSIRFLSGACTTGLGRTEVTDIHLIDDWTDVRLDCYIMDFGDISAFSDFLNKVWITGRIKGGKVAMRSISYFGGKSIDNDIVWQNTGGGMDGTVSDFTAWVDGAKDLYSGLGADVKAELHGLPEVEDLHIDASVENASLTTTVISKFVNCWSEGTDLDLSNLATDIPLGFDGFFHGLINDFKAGGNIRMPDSGEADVDLDLKGMLHPGDVKSIEGTINTRGIDAGAIAGIPAIKAVSAEVDAAMRFRGDSLRFDIKSLQASSARVLGYDLHGITASGIWDTDRLEASLSTDDRNLVMNLECGGNGKPGGGRMDYRLQGGISHADLHGMGFDKRSDVSRISAALDGRLAGIAGSNLQGNLKVGDVRLEGPEGEYDLGDILVGIRQTARENELRMTSSFADAHCTLSGGVSDFVRDVQTVTTRRDLSALYTGKAPSEEPGQYEFNLSLHDTEDLLEFAIPGLFVADGTGVELTLDGKADGLLQCSVASAALGWNGNFATDIDLSLDNAGGSLGAFLTSSRIQAGTVNLTNAALNLYAQQNEYSAGLHYDGLSGTDNVGELYLAGQIRRDSRGRLVVKARPLDSYFRLEDNLWEIGESDITVCGSDVTVEDFAIRSGDQSLSVGGGIASGRPDTLKVSIDNFDVGVVETFLKKKYGIRGKVTGEAFVFSPTSPAVGMQADLQCDSLNIGGRDAGVVHIAGDWDSETNIIKAFVSNDAGGNRALLAQGTYNPGTREIDATVALDDFSLATAAPVLDEVFSDMGGYLNGRINLDGTADDILLGSSGLRLDGATVKVAMTGAEYTISGPLSLSNAGIRVDGASITDSASGTGSITGGLAFTDGSPQVDGNLSFSNMLVIDSPAAGESPVYGQLLASGNASVSGPMDDLVLDADVTTQGEGQVHVVVSGAASGKSSDLLTFSEPPRDRAEERREQLLARLSAPKRSASASNFTAKARLTATPGVQASVEIGSGTRINAWGSGTVQMDLRPSKDILDLVGDYNIGGGSCHLDVGGVVTKDFTIQDGGSIKFGGDLMDSELDVSALYTTKVSLTNLIADTTSIATRRTVECGINISDRLRNPQLSFSLNIPALEPATKALVDGALNTEDKVQKQVVSVLLLGMFMPGETTGTGASTTTNSTIYSGVGGLMAGQISSILQKFDIPLDLGFNYQQNNTGTNVFDVGISTQLFDNRVIVNGSVRNRQYTTAANAEMAGDLDIDFKLDNAGQFRASLFSHSADKYSSFLDNTQRNGGGLSYQKEYNTLGEFFRDLFSGRRKREQRQVEEALRQKEQTIIKIDGKAVSDTDSAGR